ncbi:hypothetical protein PoB_006170100 [Plakobranchus ocellatus]|uniref:Uncharacterized protein n=1 Tax=Plakobranchus ocellatus TaxID=259542 RepID=A0AAV4CTJ9_9GAST|nr:hypothetical protein PoB_006170100 [Plakobranchus ocellatus]
MQTEAGPVVDRDSSLQNPRQQQLKPQEYLGSGRRTSANLRELLLDGGSEAVRAVVLSDCSREATAVAVLLDCGSEVVRAVGDAVGLKQRGDNSGGAVGLWQ